jgi:hypothetical protein
MSKAPNLKVIRGIPNNPSFDIERYHSVIDNFVVRPSDVFVSTFVKAGTTWIQQIIHLLLRKGVPGGRYSESIPWLEACYASDFIGPREAPGWTIDRVENNQERRFFKTHANVRDMPGRSTGIRPKVIYCARNPKDTMISLFNHAKSKPEFEYADGEFKDFFHLFLKGEVENGLWFNHVLEWYQECNENPSNTLFLRYEDMHVNTPEAISKIATFLDMKLTDEELSQVLIHSSMDEMRNSKDSNIGLNHLRQGKYGTWRNEFTVSQNEIFDEVCI